MCVIAWVGVSVSRFPFLFWKELREIGQTCEFLPVRILAKIVRVALRFLSARARSVPLRWPGLCRLVVSRPPSLGVSGARFVVPPLAVCSSAAVVVGVTSSPCLELSFIYIYAMLRVNGGGVKPEVF